MEKRKAAFLTEGRQRSGIDRSRERESVFPQIYLSRHIHKSRGGAAPDDQGGEDANSTTTDSVVQEKVKLSIVKYLL